MLKQTFIELAKSYSDDFALIDRLWDELAELYSGKKRYYHSLTHLKALLEQLSEVKEHIADWDTVLFSLFYHDSIYKAEKSDNEEQSAVLAQKRMKQLHVPEASIEKCVEQILATKKHAFSPDPDTNYFTDADLSVLGRDWETYLEYAKHVRKEYAVYPDLIYNPGRSKVLHHFLEMDRIFKTAYFYEKLEARAKENIRKELALYGKNRQGLEK
jgi:predicted metal-dependent HD superfamily phosphohydrolase